MKFTFETGGSLFKQRTVQPRDAEMLRAQAAKAGKFPVPNGSMVKMAKSKFRMYDAAATNDLNVDFPVSITSANSEILVSISASRARARRLCRDNPYASGIETTFGVNVVGAEPFRLEMKVGKKDENGKFIAENQTNQLIEDAWKEAGKPENCCASRNLSRLELYLQVISSVIRDGGILARHRRAYPKNKFGYAIEPIEIDRLDHYWNRPANGTANEIQFSIEMDEWHAPIAYWILTRHPGDVFAYSNQPKYRERVDADQVVPVFAPRLRAGQYVGMSAFAPVIQRLHRIDQYDVAEMTAAIVSAIKIGFFTKTNTADNYTGTEETEDGMKIDKVEPGMNFEEMPDNFDLKQFDPKHPVEAYAAFTNQNLRSIAQGVHLAHSTVSGDYAGMSFSTGRLEKLPERDYFMLMQEHMKKTFVHPHFNEWLKYAILSGQIPLPISRLEEFQNAACFHAKRWPYINPLQDRQADIIGIEAGLDSRSNVIAESERGGDVETVDSEIASDKAVDEVHDLDFSGIEPTEPGVSEPDGDEGEVPTKKPASKTGGKQTIKRSALNGWRHAPPVSYNHY